MAKKDKTAKPVYANAGAVVTALVTATKSARLNVAKILYTAINGGVTAAAIARAWKESDADAMNADACTKYAVAYAASLAGGDFSAVLNGLNSNALSRSDVKAWATGGEIPAEYAASGDGDGNGGNGGGKTPSEPLALTKKQLEAIVKRVKTGKVSTTDALAALAKAAQEVNAFGVATGAIKPKATVTTK